jgi:hypothetical protein
MRQRDLQDADNVTWTCVQALAGGSADTADEAAERLADGDGRVPVVCTPSGGAQSVRVPLPADWMDTLGDEELLRAIEEARENPVGG